MVFLSSIFNRYRRSVVVGRASYFSGIFLGGSWLLPFLQYIHHQISVAFFLVLGLTFIPLLVLWITSLQSWRFVLHCVIHKRHPESQIAKTRSLRCALDTRRWPGLAIALLLVKDEKIDITNLSNRILQIMQTQINTHSVLRRRLCVRFGCYLWREDDKQVDPRKQFSVWSKKVNDDLLLQEIVSSISSRQLWADRPPWEVVLIPCKRSYAVLLRAHHLIVDELPSAVELLSPSPCNLWTERTPPLLRTQWATNAIISNLLSTVTQQWSRCNTTITTYTPHKEVSKYLSVTRYWIRVGLYFPSNFVKFLVKLPRSLLEEIHQLAGNNERGISYFREAGIEIWELMKLITIFPYVLISQLTRRVENVPLLRASVSPGGRVLAWTTSVKRDFIRQVAKAGNASEVDVLLASCAGVVRQFLRNSQSKFFSIPDSVSAILPVVVGERKIAAFALLDLPTGEWDPISRVKLISKQMKIVQKRPLHVLIGALVMRFATYILPQTVLTLVLNYLSRYHTITVCFVDTPIDVMPQDSQLYYWRPPQGNAGLTFTLQLNEERVNIAIASNQSVLSDPSSLIPQFSHEILAMALALHVPLERSLTSSRRVTVY